MNASLRWLVACAVVSGCGSVSSVPDTAAPADLAAADLVQPMVSDFAQPPDLTMVEVTHPDLAQPDLLLPLALTGVTPGVGPTAGGTVVTIAASNVIVDNTLSVSIGGKAATVNTAQSSSTAIVATTPAAGAGVFGKVDVVVSSAGRTQTLAKGFTYFFSTVSFGSMVSFPTGGVQPSGLAVTDLDGDGKLDVLTNNHGPAGGGTTLATFRGNGNGTLQGAQLTTVSSGPNGVVIGDFNKDGNSDVYVPAYGGLDVLLGNGGGSFATAKVQSAPGGSIGYGDLGDLNGDGLPDVVYETAGIGTYGAALGNGDGTLKTPRESASGFGSSGWVYVALGDFDNDKKLDLVATSSAYSNLRVMRGNGDGTFQASYAVTVAARTVAAPLVRDVDGDGNLDVIVSDTSAGVMWVLLGLGTGTFASPIQIVTSAGVTAHDLADIDGDGMLDLLTGNGDTNPTVGVLLGKGAGKFAAMKTYPAGSYPIEVRARDMNGDGKLDLVVVNYGDATVGILPGSSQ